MYNNKKIILCSLLLAVGIATGWIFRGYTFQKSVPPFYPIRLVNSGYTFVNPLLGYDTVRATEFGEYTDLEGALQEAVDKRTGNKDANQISVYFRDFNRGRWVGVGEEVKYSPASLMKVPLMMDYFKISESDSSIWSQKIKFDQTSTNIDSIQSIKPIDPVIPGQTYTVEELVRKMITDSDNNALALLLSNISDVAFKKIFTDLGILFPGNSDPSEFMSPKTYSLFFRVLYGATYLNKDNSEKALSLLNQAEYKKGLVAGVPENIKVAHKFGEFISTEQKTMELHDCGIVYYPKHPYMLCVMTEGTDMTKLQGVISNISKITYQELTNEYK